MEGIIVALYQDEKLNNFMQKVVDHNPGEQEFVQAVRETSCALFPFIEKFPKYREDEVLERLTEPDRIIRFRVTWEDDKGRVHNNRGYRVQHCNAIGPYKGGLRFHPSVNQSILKFLAFEQTFKNALTGLPLGGAKGGADFNPKGRSDREIKRFCQAFMTELHRYIGPNIDIPAGDTGVGSREVSYLFGEYKRITNTFAGVLTGKGLSFGGSRIRSEATGYGCVYIASRAMRFHGQDLSGTRCCISGSGQVALYAAEKLIQMGCKVVTLSDSLGFIYVTKGLNKEQLNQLMDAKFSKRVSLADWAKDNSEVEYFSGKKPWGIACECAFPCAVQNEMNCDEAKTLIKNGCKLIAEGANMPLTHEAKDYLQQKDVVFLPGKMANAGGVAVSGLEMSQNSSFQFWSREVVDDQLKKVMERIHQTCLEHLEEGEKHYEKAANIAGFIKVADSIQALGV